MILTDLAYFTNISNRLLTCGIVIYRYVLVLQSSWVQSPYYRRAFENLIFISILVAAVTLTVWSVVLQDFNLLKHRCFETTEQFYYNFNNFYEEKKIGSPIWDLPLTHPFHALTLICFFASMGVAPIGYLMIFWWVKWFSKRNIIVKSYQYNKHYIITNIVRFTYKQDSKAPGLSSNARKMRRHRNIVSMKFNMINWILESLINILILSGSNRIFTILYILVMSSGTPLVYFMGIEENRKQAKEHFKSNIRVFIKQRKHKMKM